MQPVAGLIHIRNPSRLMQSVQDVGDPLQPVLRQPPSVVPVEEPFQPGVLESLDGH